MIWRTILLAGLLLCGNAAADNMLMARIPMKADLAIEYLKTSVEEHGYSVAHVQLCDTGMADFGYKSDFYRVVFFAKIDEVRHISEAHPEFVPYLPLKVAVIAERDETVVTAVNPRTFEVYYPEDQSMRVQFGRWYNDLQSIYDDLRSVSKTRASEVKAAPAAGARAAAGPETAG